MPSLAHEILVDIFREHPDLVLSLLRSMMDLPLPVSVVGRDAAATFAELRPAEYRADAVLAFSDATGAARLAVTAEIRARIERCREQPVLERWLVRAATANEASDVFV